MVHDLTVQGSFSPESPDAKNQLRCCLRRARDPVSLRNCTLLEPPVMTPTSRLLRLLIVDGPGVRVYCFGWPMQPAACARRGLR